MWDVGCGMWDRSQSCRPVFPMSQISYPTSDKSSRQDLFLNRCLSKVADAAGFLIFNFIVDDGWQPGRKIDDHSHRPHLRVGRVEEGNIRYVEVRKFLSLHRLHTVQRVLC